MPHSTSPCSGYNYIQTAETSQELREAWIKFLDNWSWDWFCTFTFPDWDYVHPEFADKKFRVFVSKANRELYGPRWYEHGKGIRWARALETQKRGTLHYHALLGDDRLYKLRRLTYMDIWSSMAGWCRIQPPRSSESVRAYCSKYVAKGGEIELGGPLARNGLPLLEFGQVVTTPEPDGANQA